MLLAQGTTPFYENISKLVGRSALNLGGTHLNIRKDLGEMVNRGQEYYEGTAADSVIWNATLNSLNRAVADWRSSTPVIFERAKPHVLTFLAEVSQKQLATVDWALEVCRYILIRYDARLSGTSVSPQPSEPGLEPAAGAGNSVSDSAEVTRAAVADAAVRVKKAWETKEFSVTLKRTKSGEVK